MRQGRIAGELPRGASQEDILRLAAFEEKVRRDSTSAAVCDAGRIVHRPRHCLAAFSDRDRIFRPSFGRPR